MEKSPLTQQFAPEKFKPKVVHLYEALFPQKEEEDHGIELTDGFWQELFLLKPNLQSLQRILAGLDAEDMLHYQSYSQQLLHEAIARIKDGPAPADEIALDTLTVFLGSVLTKKYTNPSSDIITVLSGLDDVDSIFSDFVGALDGVIRNGRDLQVRQKAITTTLALISGAYQTSLVTYFTHRDLFPSLMKFVQETEEPSQASGPFILIGLLANYNKFEFQNPYRFRLDDFVNDAAIGKVVQGVGHVCHEARDRYVAVQDDLPEGWSFVNTLGYIGLGAWTGKKPKAPAPSPEEAKNLLNNLTLEGDDEANLQSPPPEAAILLSTYDFANSNKLFCFNFATLPSLNKNEPPAFGSFLSLTSYMFQHAYRSQRVSLYSYLSLFILQLLVEDQVLAKRICADEGRLSVRLCRQRAPHLPIVKDERIVALVIMDIMIDGINHNLRRKLDTQFFRNLIAVVSKEDIIFESSTNEHSAYHWSELWRSLLSLTKFLTTYSSDIATLSGSTQLVDDLVSLIVLALSAGESFLPDPGSYDDLFYKIVESSDTLTKFRDAYNFPKRPSSSSIDTLISVCSHYNELLESEKGKLRNKHLGPRHVSRVIKQGYESLSFAAKEDLDHFERFKEADYRNVLKMVARVAVKDVQTMVGEKYVDV
ncbi:MAG: hypothetical protein M1820_007995 [Bogoriella megaspora]|nr:MAG: hypothetical protein M1820_007995 [Bogoriella megaspora]